MLNSFLFSSPIKKWITENHYFHWIMIFIFSMLLLFPSLYKGDLSGYDDAFYAHEGKQMLITGDWWNITINGHLNFEYPPLFIWLEAISFSVFGVNDFAAKFPSALLGLLTIVFLFLLAKELNDDFWFPIIASWVLILTQYFLKYAMHAMTDVPFTFFFTLAIYFYLKGLRRSNYFILCGIALALGILTRSAIGLIPLGIILSHLVLTKQYRLLFSGRLMSAVGLAFFIPSIWYVSQYQIHGEMFLKGHFSFIEGKIKSEKPIEILSVLSGFAEYPWLLIKLYQPWFFIMVIGFVINLKKGIFEGNPNSILLILWVALIIVPFSFAETKILRYIMPVFPAFAVLAATPLNNWLKKVKRENIFQVGYLILAVLVLLIALLSNPKHRAEEMKRIALAIEIHTPEKQKVVFYTGPDIKHNFNNQIVWYSSHFTDILRDDSTFLERFNSTQRLTFVMDRITFERLVANSGVSIETLEETENFIYFRKA